MNGWWGLRTLLRHRSRSALSVFGIGIATALLLDMTMLAGGLEQSFERLLLSRGYQLRVTPAGSLPFDTEATLQGAAEIRTVLAADRDVTGVAPVLGTSIAAPGGEPVVVYGIDPAEQGIYELVDGVEPSSVDDAVVSAAAGRLFGVGIGDRLELRGRADALAGEVRAMATVRVTGIVRFLYDARDQASIAVTLDVAQRLAALPIPDPVSVLMVRVGDDADPAVVAARLGLVVPDASVGSIDGLVRQFRSRLAYFRQLSAVLAVISLGVAIMLAGTLLAIGVSEQARDLATLRAIGCSRRTIVRTVLAQGMALLLTGAVVGVPLGLLAARWLDGILTAFPGLPASVSFFIPDPPRVALALVVLGASGLLVMLPIALRVTRTDLSAALREEAT